MSGGKKPPTAAELNARSRKQWDEWNAQIRSFERKHPAKAREALEHSAELVKRGFISVPELAKETSYTGAIIASVELLVAEQSIRAKMPRVRKDAACRLSVITAMRRARKDGDSLKQFISAASTSAGKVKLTFLQSSSKNEYLVDYDHAADEITVSLKTLKNWWTAAAK